MNDKFKTIQLENIVIYIYFILLLLYLYANNIEINYIKYQNKIDKDNYRKIVLFVFVVSLIISILYTISNIKDLNDYEKNNIIYNLKQLSALASILIVIATTIYIYIIYKDENIDLEISP